jgi:hypothetical protein
MSRAIDALVDAFNRIKQSAATPTVNRLTLNVTSPETNIELSLYTDGTDAWFLDGDGNRIQLTSNGAVNAVSGGGGGSSIPYSSVWYGPTWTAGNALDTRGPTNDQCRAFYMGRAPQAISSIKVLWRQTAGATISYAEMGIATGAYSPLVAPSLVIRGYVDSAVEWTTASFSRNKTISITGADIAAGEDIWAVYTVNFTAGAPTIAVSNVSDRLDIGALAIRNATRLSTNLNTAPLAFTIDASATPPWIAFSIN